VIYKFKKNKLMKVKMFFLIVLSFVIFSCNKNSSSKNRPLYPKTGNYYSTANTNESIKFADPIIYDVVVKNSDSLDEWKEFCLKNTDVNALEKTIFNAVYQGKLISYYYRSDDSILPIDSIKKMELDFASDKFGKIQFNEEWYFDENNLEFYKKINSLTFGYELVNDLGEIYGYKPAFKVYLGKNEKNTTK